MTITAQQQLIIDTAAATQAQQVIVNCDVSAEVTQALAQINAWAAANPGRLASQSVTGKKLTLLFAPIPVNIASVVACEVRIAAWSAANPGTVQSFSVTGRKVTVIMLPVAVVPTTLPDENNPPLVP